MRFQREQLETLVAVLAEGTFDGAARRLRITPSAVSQRVKAFEQQLGRVLVQRTKPVRATASGEVLLRLAQQQALLEADAAIELGADGGRVVVPLAVNADSLASWFLPALAAVDRAVAFDLHRDDQEHTAALLAAGTVMGAVSSRGVAVPGCTVTPLGRMRYRAVASRAFAERWFAGGVDAASLASAPVVDFDRKDELQSGYLRAAGVTEPPPRHFVPASADFARAIGLGLGWGMLPDLQRDDAELAAAQAQRSGTGARARSSAGVRDGAAPGSPSDRARSSAGVWGRSAPGSPSGRARESVRARHPGAVLVDLPGDPIDVPLYWQQWNLRSPVLDEVADAVRAAARTALS